MSGGGHGRRVVGVQAQLPTEIKRHLSAADVEAVAAEVVRQLAQIFAPGVTDDARARKAVMTAAEVARAYGVKPAWVRAHATELHVRRLGSGPRPRLRFDPRLVAAALESSVDADAAVGGADWSVTARSTGKRSQAPDRPQRQRHSSIHPGVTASGSPLLPVRGASPPRNDARHEATPPRPGTTKETT